MLRNIRNDLLYCLSISESVGKIKLYSGNCQRAESFYNLNEQLNFNASLNLLANIGDRVSKFSDELRNKYQQIDWQKIRSFRFSDALQKYQAQKNRRTRRCARKSKCYTICGVAITGCSFRYSSRFSPLI